MAVRVFLVCALACTFAAPASAQALPNTKLLTGKEDFAATMVDGIDAWLDRAVAASVKQRAQHWKRDFTSPQAYEVSITPNRERFRRLIGVVDERLPPRLEYVATHDDPALRVRMPSYDVHRVRWSVLPGVDAEGLLLEPKGKPIADVVALPDADTTPETLAGISKEETPAPLQLARLLVERGCRVLVPTLIDRNDAWSNNPAIGRHTNQPHREFVYRMAFEMGRHVIGYEVQKVLAAVDWFQQQDKELPIGVVGHGEGGLLAFYSAAVDPRIRAAVVCGYFGPREQLAEEPIYRNVWKLLREFGDAELAALVAPRTLIVVPCDVPAVIGPPTPQAKKAGAAPGKISSVAREDVDQEFARARTFAYEPLGMQKRLILAGLAGADPHSSRYWLDDLITSLGGPAVRTVERIVPVQREVDPRPRQERQFRQLVDYTQKLLPEAKVQRERSFWSQLDKSSLAALEKSAAPLRDRFAEEVIGKLPVPTMPINPRTRLAYETPKWKGYEVVLDLYEDVICYGILLVPNDLQPGEKRPVVVCQHGLEGRPQDVVDPKTRTRAYNSFGAQLADRGYIVFAPQNPYIFENKFRQLVRKGNPLGLTLYSFIVAQHERILDWLVTLPFVDPGRIAYYGLSYGGKVAMRIPVLVGRYCLVICSGDFNEWIWKNITLDWGSSYMFTREYEMYEFDLANTFNYAEMAALLAPRRFMVERGHRDGVGLDEYVAFEYARVRRFFVEIGLGERTELEFFAGGHEIHGQGTFRFLDRNLK